MLVDVLDGDQYAAGKRPLIRLMEQDTDHCHAQRGSSLGHPSHFGVNLNTRLATASCFSRVKQCLSRVICAQYRNKRSLASCITHSSPFSRF